MSLVAEDKLVHVYRSHITSFTKDTVTLQNGKILPSNGTVFATGWKPNQTSIFPSSLLPDLGFPFILGDESSESKKHWDAMDQNSEKKVRDLFPVLAHPPKEVIEYDTAHSRPQTHTPFRLFRNIASPTLCARNQRDIVVLGTLLNTAVPTYAEVSSLWGVAYLENLPFSASATATLSSLAQMENDVSLLNAWGWVRYRDKSMSYLDGSVEIQDFIDLLVSDLGLPAMRKKEAERKKGQVFGLRGSVKEWLWPYKGGDYDGLVADYLERWGLGQVEKHKEGSS
jgi:dimethylaniline monooxygenase (N-oxide forming)